LLAHGRVVHGGRTLVTAEARVEDANGVLYAHGSGSFLVYPSK
jgi:acyl-coenzyme A thioesterase PaaI-like protein